MPKSEFEEEEEPEDDNTDAGFLEHNADEQAAVYEPVDNEPHVLLAEYRFESRHAARNIANNWGEEKSNWGDHPVIRTVIGVVPAKVYDSERQHYIFLEDGDIFQDGDEFVYPGDGWVPVRYEYFGKIVKGVMAGEIIRREVV